MRMANHWHGTSVRDVTTQATDKHSILGTDGHDNSLFAGGRRRLLCDWFLQLHVAGERIVGKLNEQLLTAAVCTLITQPHHYLYTHSS